jgi:hypothetical protein
MLYHGVRRAGIPGRHVQSVVSREEERNWGKTVCAVGCGVYGGDQIPGIPVGGIDLSH